MSTFGARTFAHPIALLGAALTTISAVLFVMSLLLEVVGFHTSPYLGIVTFIGLPALFLLGLALIPIGTWRQRRRVARGDASPWPVLDLSLPPARRLVAIVGVLTIVNVAIVALAAAKGVEYVDSTGFCGTVCHTAMKPESIAHRGGPHARVTCASCHVGPGPQGFVAAKMGGVRRLVAVVRGNYARPVAAPVHDLPSTQGTCENCHDPRAWLGDRLRKVSVFADDEANTDQTEVLTVRAGGGGWDRGGPQGAHWHASPDHRVEYVATDARRDTIAWVRVVDRDGKTRDFAAGGADPRKIPAGERRTMDCVDCHNRVGHPIAISTGRAVDEALASGLLPSLPFVRREAVAALDAAVKAPGDRSAGRRLESFYAKAYPALSTGAGPGLRRAIAGVDAIQARHVFPAMRVAFASYPDRISHTDDKGCFRCHDDEHKAVDGGAIPQDCERCHTP
ncbi:MAG: cytochrome C [Vicinamibacteraceae bacterium]